MHLKKYVIIILLITNRIFKIDVIKKSFNTLNMIILFTVIQKNHKKCVSVLNIFMKIIVLMNVRRLHIYN